MTFAASGSIALEAPATVAGWSERGSNPRPWLGEESPNRESPLAALLDHLPLERVQHRLGTDRRLRVVEVAVGAALVGYGCTRGNAAPGVLYAGVQAIRLSGGTRLEPGGVRIEPSISGNTLAVYVRKTM